MITIVAKKIIKEGKIEEFKVLAENLIIESRNEIGCISYNLFQDINNFNTLTFIEEWISEDAIKLHNNSKHFTSIVPKFVDLQEGETMVNLYKMV